MSAASKVPTFLPGGVPSFIENSGSIPRWKFGRARNPASRGSSSRRLDKPTCTSRKTSALRRGGERGDALDDGGVHAQPVAAVLPGSIPARRRQSGAAPAAPGSRDRPWSRRRPPCRGLPEHFVGRVLAEDTHPLREEVAVERDDALAREDRARERIGRLHRPPRVEDRVLARLRETVGVRSVAPSSASSPPRSRGACGVGLGAAVSASPVRRAAAPSRSRRTSRRLHHARRRPAAAHGHGPMISMRWSARTVNCPATVISSWTM